MQNKILNSLVNILEQEITRLKPKVKDEEEDTYINGSLEQAKCVLTTIYNLKELYGGR